MQARINFRPIDLRDKMGTFKRLDLSLNVTSSQNFHTEYMLKGIIFDIYISKFNQFMMEKKISDQIRERASFRPLTAH